MTAYINKQLYDETIRALTVMKDTGLIAISTPLGPDNFISILIDMKDERGEDFYNIMHLTTICDACKLLPTKSQQMACRHTFLPSWKSHDKQARNAQAGRMTGSINTTLQEDCGIIVPGQNGIIFDADHLTRAFNRADKNKIFDTKSYTPSRIYVMLDPNADNNGSASNSAVFSCFWAPPPRPTLIRKDNEMDYEREFVMPFPQFVLLGVDVSASGLGRDKDNLVLSHIRKIRNMKQYAKTPIIYVPEQGTGSEASRGEDIVRQIGNTVVCLRESGGSMFGVRKTDTITADYVNTWQTLMDNDQIRWSQDFFTLSHDYAENVRRGLYKKGTDEDIVLADCKIEMSRMKYVKRKITGKEGGFNDDMAVCLMMAAYWSKAVENINAECYASYRNLVWVDAPIMNNSNSSLDLNKYGKAIERGNMKTALMMGKRGGSSEGREIVKKIGKELNQRSRRYRQKSLTEIDSERKNNNSKKRKLDTTESSGDDDDVQISKRPRKDINEK